MKLKLYEIIPQQLYQSAKTHDLTVVECTDLVESYQLSVVVNLWHTEDPTMKALVPQYFHWYLPDGYLSQEGFDEMMVQALHITNLINEGKVALVHCWGGRNRSGLFNAMVLMHLYEYSGEFAYEYIRTMRPNSLVNETFANWLKER